MNGEPIVLKYKVSDFEGPLDMLLQLIAKHKMDIYDIEISALLEQYMEQINQMQENQMDISSEFLEMASRLIFVKGPSNIKFDMTYTRIHQSEDIAKAFAAAAGRGKSKLPPPREAFSGIVERKIVSVSSRVVYVLRKLWGGTAVKYRKLFEDGSPKSELVATFLAVLELVKNSRIRIEGDGDNADVILMRKDKSGE